MNILEAYEAAAASICAAIQQDAATHKMLGGKGWHALLPTDEFHDRCMALARKHVLFGERP